MAKRLPTHGANHLSDVTLCGHSTLRREIISVVYGADLFKLITCQRCLRVNHGA